MSQAYIKAVCLSDKRGVPKKTVQEGHLKNAYGLLGDAHAGRGDKEVSILLSQYLTSVKNSLGMNPEPGSFAENLLVDGMEEEKIAIGTVLQIGEAVLEVESIGKDPSESHSYSFHGFSLLADKGVFCRVVRSGLVKSGDMVVVSN